MDQDPRRYLIENASSGFVGVFLFHEQRLRWINSAEKRSVQYQLNPKLFAINEPYLMKTERDALVKMKLEADVSNHSNGANADGDDGEHDGKTLANRGKKRKKSLAKKVAYLDGNLTTLEEKSMANKLIQKFLTKNANCLSLDEKTLLNQINLQENGANCDAQTFVNSLFRNRFESLNYRTKLFCNPYNKVLRVKFGLSHYLVPARCSFAGMDIVEGVQMVTKYLKIASVSNDAASLVCPKNPFMLIMDPAWDNNKSVKRKRAYETVSLDYLRRMCRELKSLNELIISIKSSISSSANKCSTSSPLKLRSKPNKSNPIILSAIWTTKADKDFVVQEMLPLMGLECAYEFKWHKVTTSGLPVKVHGGAEFLIVAQNPTNSHYPVEGKTNKHKAKKGIIVSIPSAIHSHKPSVLTLFQQLYGVDQPYKKSTGSGDTSHSDYYGPNDYCNIASNEIIVPLCGLELFARYLNTGFHSIGFECIKLQNEELFITSEH